MSWRLTAHSTMPLPCRPSGLPDDRSTTSDAATPAPLPVRRISAVRVGCVQFLAPTGSWFEASIGDRIGGGEPVTVVGTHCESGDVLVEQMPMREPQVGDLLAIPATGTYCYTMANKYNGARRVPVVFARRRCTPAGGASRNVVGPDGTRRRALRQRLHTSAGIADLRPSSRPDPTNSRPRSAVI